MKHNPDEYTERMLMTIFALFGVPDSYLDLGSGTGAMAMLAAKMGVQATGVDNEPTRPGRCIVQADLTQPQHFRRFDLVTCLEVAEHIPPGDGETVFIKNVCDHVAPGGLLVFSAAVPGQGGDGHVNLKQPIYWRDRLWEYGRLTYNRKFTAELSLLLTYTAGPAANWVPANVQVFTK